MIAQARGFCQGVGQKAAVEFKMGRKGSKDTKTK
jgi:hypothetical protein